ncbi:MAG TPA: hypothetical protein VMZ28_17645 [Kofleriaceae bacterium]|nr:hypothetical protein [Kofleriaceae bacterium]
MVEFMKSGGWSMWFVLLLALGALVAAGLFVARADLRKLALVRALTWATLLSIASGLCANFAAVMHYAASDPPDLHQIIMQGLAEAVAPGVLGFTMLSISWLLVAVGTRRVQDRAE